MDRLRFDSDFQNVQTRKMAEETAEEMAEETKLKTHTRVFYQDIIKARANDEFRAAIDDTTPVNYDKNQQLMQLIAENCF
jgi:hypothetical protein